MRSYTITTWHPQTGTRTGAGKYRNITSARIDAAREAAQAGAAVEEITCDEDGTGWPFAIHPAEPTDAADLLRQAGARYDGSSPECFWARCNGTFGKLSSIAYAAGHSAHGEYETDDDGALFFYACVSLRPAATFAEAAELAELIADAEIEIDAIAIRDAYARPIQITPPTKTPGRD